VDKEEDGKMLFRKKKLKGTPLQGTKVALSHSNWGSKI